MNNIVPFKDNIRNLFSKAKQKEADRVTEPRRKPNRQELRTFFRMEMKGDWKKFNAEQKAAYQNIK